MKYNIDKRAPMLSVMVASVTQSTPAKWQSTSAIHGTSKGKIELKKYSREKMTQCQWDSANSYMSSRSMPGS